MATPDYLDDVLHTKTYSARPTYKALEIGIMVMSTAMAALSALALLHGRLT